MELPCEGGCACGAVRYRLSAEPATVYLCHCTDCQRMSGSSFGVTTAVASEAVELLSGTPERFGTKLADGRPKFGERCPQCGTRLWGKPARFPQVLNLISGTLDDTSWIEPVGHIWLRSKQPWFEPAPGTLQFEEQADDMMALVRAWKDRPRSK